MDSDADAVEAQLGRPPRGKWRVARRCRCGLPQVIETDPLLADETPFPTLWWLTCRTLVTAVSGLEHSGWMGEFNKLLSGDEAVRTRLRQSIEGYLGARDAIQPLDSSDHPGGGPSRVKCLHAHTAHHLITSDNPVGEAALKQLGWAEPEEPCV